MSKGKAFTLALVAVLALALLGAAMKADMKAGIDGVSVITRAFFEFGGDDEIKGGPILETFPQETK